MYYYKPSNESDSHNEKKVTEEDSWKIARELLTEDSDLCHVRIPELCIKDEKMIDPILQRVLDQSFHSKMPRNIRDIRSVVRRCSGAYSSQQINTPKNRAIVAQKIADYYANPRVIVEKNIAKVIVGPVPGTFEKRGRSGYTMMPAYWKNKSHWPLVEAAKMAQKILTKYPEIDFLKMKVLVPSIGAGGYATENWFYSKATHRLWVMPDRPTEAFFTEKISDFNTFITKAKMMKLYDLDRCTLQDKGWNEAKKGCPL